MIHSEKKEADCRVAPHVPERKLWCGFSGKRWEPDVGGLKAMELSKSLADELMVYALNIGDGQTRKEYIDQCKKWQVRRRPALHFFRIDMLLFVTMG